jgi:hypothetical protein
VLQSPVLAGTVECWRNAENKATINIVKIKSLVGHKFFFPCGGMAVVKSLLYVNKN